MKYDNAACNQFVTDMKAAGYKVEHYRGRFFWRGPAVRINGDYHTLIRATAVPLQHDSMGCGRIYYPIRPGQLVEGKTER